MSEKASATATPSIIVLEGLPSVTGFDFSADGKKIAIVSDASLEDMTTRILDVETGKELRQLEGAGLGFFSSDGKKIAMMSGAEDTTMSILEVETGKELQKWEGVDIFSLSRFSFSSDGKRVATIDGKIIRIWDVETEKELQKLEGHTNADAVASAGFFTDEKVVSANFSADGKKMITREGKSDGWFSGTISDEVIRIWDVETGKELRNLEIFAATGKASSSFSSDRQRILVTGEDNIARIFAWGELTEADLKPFVVARQRIEREKAERGDADAQFKLGMCYFNGDGVPQNVTEAVKWIRKEDGK